MPKNITEIELPDGTFVALHGYTAQQAAAYIAKEIGGVVKPTIGNKAARQAPQPHVPSSGLTINVPPHVQSLLGMNSAAGHMEARDEYVSNEEPLEMPDFAATQPEPAMHPADRLVYAGQPPHQSHTFNEGEEPLELPEMKFDKPEFMKREFRDEKKRSVFAAPQFGEEALEMPQPILAD